MKFIIPSLVMLAFSTAMAEQGAVKKTTADASASKSQAAASSREKPTEGPAKKDEPRIAAVSSIEPEELDGFDHYAPQVQQLVRDSLALTRMNLTYTFGSSNPKQGGMDCSGTIYYLLKEHGFKDVPRQSNEMCGWVQDRTLLHRIEKADSLKDPAFSALQPGDLLFWSGTYDAGPRTIPVTHVMIYLGKTKKAGRHLMFGASDGRVYLGERRTGVSVFDFTLPKESSPSKFYGYGMIPGVGRIVHKTPEPKLAEASAEATTQPASPAIKDKEAPPVVAEMPPKATTPATKAKSTAPEEAKVTSKPAAPGIKEKDTASEVAVMKPKSVTPEPEETVKKAIVLKPEEPADVTPASKKTSTGTSSVAKKKSTPTTTAAASKAKPQTTSKNSTVNRKTGPSSSRSSTPGTDVETKLRQKAREVGDSIKNILSR